MLNINAKYYINCRRLLRRRSLFDCTGLNCIDQNCIASNNQTINKSINHIQQNYEDDKENDNNTHELNFIIIFV